MCINPCSIPMYHMKHFTPDRFDRPAQSCHPTKCPDTFIPFYVAPHQIRSNSDGPDVPSEEYKPRCQLWDLGGGRQNEGVYTLTHQPEHSHEYRGLSVRMSFTFDLSTRGSKVS
jgi:hypothetical protein